jgi:hypothetical protein
METKADRSNMAGAEDVDGESGQRIGDEQETTRL